jgi:hypothetical protein
MYDDVTQSRNKLFLAVKGLASEGSSCIIKPHLSVVNHICKKCKPVPDKKLIPLHLLAFV